MINTKFTPMKHLTFTLFFFLGTMTFAQDFYNLESIQTKETTFGESNWDQLLDNVHDGTLFYQNIIFESTQIDTSDWVSGMYIGRVDNAFLKIVVN